MKRSVRVMAGIAVLATIVGVAASCGSDSVTAPVKKMYSAALAGPKEVPPTTSAATGTATFTDNTTSIDYAISVSSLTAITASHIHVGASTVAGPIIINLFIPNGASGAVSGNLATGTITSANNASVSLDSLRTLFKNGNAYVNVHTSANPGGDIRGQVAAIN